jgi:hypothetical protein
MIDIVCIRGIGDKEASEIQDDLIPSEFIARMRGTNFINANWYKVYSRIIGVPFKDDVTIGRKIPVVDSAMNIVGVHIVTGHNITISRDGVWSRVTVEQYEEGE